MNRISQLDPATSTGKTKQLFDAVQQKLGLVPNMVRVMGHAPAALEAYRGFSGALAQGTFDARLREQIALTVGESNMCSYCLSAHTFMAASSAWPRRTSKTRATPRRRCRSRTRCSSSRARW
jgi:alkylhydroperoxidase family enzyme